MVDTWGELAELYGMSGDELSQTGFGGQGYGTSGTKDTAAGNYPLYADDWHSHMLYDQKQKDDAAKNAVIARDLSQFKTELIQRGIRGKPYDAAVARWEAAIRAGEIGRGPTSSPLGDLAEVLKAEGAKQHGAPLVELVDRYGGKEALETLIKNDPGVREHVQGVLAAQGVTPQNIAGLSTSPSDIINQVLEGDFKGLADQLFTPPNMLLPMPATLAMQAIGQLSGIIGTYTDQFGREMGIYEDGSVAPISFDDDWGAQPSGLTYGGYNPEGSLMNQLIPRGPVGQGLGFDRNAALNQLIEDTLANTVNPGIADNYFNSIIKEGIRQRNTALGPDVSQQQFENEFLSGRLGQELLDEESASLRDIYSGQVGNVFTGKAFEPITDDTAISNILSSQRESALGDISRFGTRGNLSATGGATAGQYITSKEPEARSRLEEIGESVRGTGQRDVDVIRDRALQQTGAFNLGDPFFDIAPFASERESLIQGRLPQIESGIRSQLGAEQLFDAQQAIQEGAASQGLVSGAPSFLDQLAARSGVSRYDRGIGTRGSGVF